MIHDSTYQQVTITRKTLFVKNHFIKTVQYDEINVKNAFMSKSMQYKINICKNLKDQILRFALSFFGELRPEFTHSQTNLTDYSRIIIIFSFTLYPKK